MAQVHNTDTIPERDRIDLLNTAFANSESPQSVTYVATDGIRHRMELFDLGAGAHLLRNTGTGLRIVRSERHVRLGAPDQLAVCMQSKGTGLAMTGAGSELHLPGELWFLDTTRPYTYQQSAVSDHKVMLVDPTLLDLPIDVLRSAMPGLKASPVYSLVRAHFVELCNATTDLPPHAAASVREATVHLIRALVTTAVDDRRQGEAMRDSQVLRITMFIEAHLHDRTLTVERIAGAHGISARQLYNVWARAGKDASLAEWIMQRRLDQARQKLAGADPTATIATVARTSGFTNMSHFSQRFRDAFGMSPREWRYLHRVEG